MVQKKATPGTNARAPRSTTTKTVETSANAKLLHVQRLVNEWQNIASDFDPDDYLKIVSQLFGVSEEDIAGQRRFPSHVKARHLWWACLRHYGKWSYPEIGSYVGLDHTGVMRSIAKVPHALVEAIGELIKE